MDILIVPVQLFRERQLSGLRPKACDNLTAISGEIPACPFNSNERVFRVIPRPSAAFVTVRPRVLMHRSPIISPGCGGSS